jgi:archaeosortase A (PGF-CTERM-specific)
MPDPITDIVAWVTVGLLATGAIAERFNQPVSHYVFTGSWAIFAVFWALLVPHFIFEMHSFIEGVGSLLAVPASLYVAYLHYTRRESLLVLSRAVAVMGLIYLPFALIHPLREFLVELVSTQLYLALTTLGYHPEFTTAEANGFRSAFVFTGGDGHKYLTYLVLGCTGIGSMSIMSGLIAAVRAPIRRKLRAVAVVIPAIWVLNLVRNVFIALGFAKQWFQVFVNPIMTIVGYTDASMVSFFIADRVLAQSLSVVALLVLTWLVARDLPELLSIIEEVLFVFTNQTYDLGSAFEHR